MQVIVSMTSIPARNGRLASTLASLQSQTRLPDEIRLYLGPGCALVADVTCVDVEDRGPITKLSAVVDPEIPDDALIVTVDDDILYEPTWLETLVAAAEASPGAVVGRSGWLVADFLRSEHHGYFIWAQEDTCDVLEGWAGVAYRKSFFDGSVLEPPPEFRLVDDVWISGYLYRRGIERRIVRPPMAIPDPKGLPGLHNRSDFVKLNRKAARIAFAP
jgi:hypothetical protein